jgi:hypothetical protein
MRRMPTSIVCLYLGTIQTIHSMNTKTSTPFSRVLRRARGKAQQRRARTLMRLTTQRRNNNAN